MLQAETHIRVGGQVEDDLGTLQRSGAGVAIAEIVLRGSRDPHVGAEVTELIQGFVIAMGLETTEEELMHTVFPHPTLSEMMHESVLDAYGHVIHM